jgi:hypothetical protein
LSGTFSVTSVNRGAVIDAAAGNVTTLTLVTGPQRALEQVGYATGDANPLPVSGALCLVDQGPRGDRVLVNHRLDGIPTGTPFLQNGTLPYTALRLQSCPLGATISVTTA